MPFIQGLFHFDFLLRFLLFVTFLVVFVVRFVVFVSLHWALIRFGDLRNVHYLNLICEFYSKVTSFYPRSFRFWSRRAFHVQVLTQDFIIHIGNHVGRLHEGEWEWRPCIEVSWSSNHCNLYFRKHTAQSVVYGEGIDLNVLFIDYKAVKASIIKFLSLFLVLLCFLHVT